MERHIIGIDTGGTYTDAILFDTLSAQVVATTKKPTSHHRLSLGIGEALTELLAKSDVAPDTIGLVAVSSTLATNSVVENKGARVAIIVIGYVKHFKLPVEAVVFIKGGHTIQGLEEEPLDIDYLVQTLGGLKNHVDAYGVCSAMSMKNPTHELVAEKAIGMIDPKPVFCSHRISHLTGMEERAATAGLHARLMPVMEDFVGSVQAAMSDRNLHCPMVIIGGNGKAHAVDKVVTEAGETAASGPACSAHFGATAGIANCLVIDVGGTTTDIAIIEDGRPVLAEDGCRIGRWKTHVEAIDMHTGGIGGDSHVHLNEHNQLTIGPARVVPISIAGTLPPVEEWLGNGGHSRLIVLQPEAGSTLAENELTSLLVQQRYLTPAEIRRRTGLGGIPLDRQLESLARKQQIFACGFTPTDALHVLGKIALGNSSVAHAGAEKLGGLLGLSAAEFAELVVGRTQELIENLIIDYVIERYWHNSLGGFVASRNDHPVLGISFSVKLPLVGIGAAARYFLPAVAERLNTTIYFPEHCDTGNAVGAAIIGRDYVL